MRRTPREREDLVLRAHLQGLKKMLPKIVPEGCNSKSRDKEGSFSHGDTQVMVMGRRHGGRGGKEVSFLSICPGQ